MKGIQMINRWQANPPQHKRACDETTRQIVTGGIRDGLIKPVVHPDGQIGYMLTPSGRDLLNSSDEKEQESGRMNDQIADTVTWLLSTEKKVMNRQTYEEAYRFYRTHYKTEGYSLRTMNEIAKKYGPAIEDAIFETVGNKDIDNKFYFWHTGNIAFVRFLNLKYGF